MANLKASKKSIKTTKARTKRNVAQVSELKTTTKKVLEALDAGDITAAQSLLKIAESKIAKARGKGILKKNTASRKVSRLAKKVATATRTAS